MRSRVMASRTYRRVHTGANTHAGGVMAGFCKAEYQEGSEDEVMNVPATPTPSVNENAATILRMFFMVAAVLPHRLRAHMETIAE